MTVLYLREKSYVQSLSFLLLENSAIFFQNKRGNLAHLLLSILIIDAREDDHTTLFEG